MMVAVEMNCNRSSKPDVVGVGCCCCSVNDERNHTVDATQMVADLSSAVGIADDK